MVTIKATIYFEKRFWLGTFERTDKEGYAVARHIFGAEPSDPEVHEFILNPYLELKFGKLKELQIQMGYYISNSELLIGLESLKLLKSVLKNGE